MRDELTAKGFLAACILMIVASLLPAEYHLAHMSIGVAAILVFGVSILLDTLS